MKKTNLISIGITLFALGLLTGQKEKSELQKAQEKVENEIYTRQLAEGLGQAVSAVVKEFTVKPFEILANGYTKNQYQRQPQERQYNTKPKETIGNARVIINGKECHYKIIKDQIFNDCGNN